MYIGQTKRGSTNKNTKFEGKWKPDIIKRSTISTNEMDTK